jgi:hypothetical protein
VNDEDAYASARSVARFSVGTGTIPTFEICWGVSSVSATRPFDRGLNANSSSTTSKWRRTRRLAPVNTTTIAIATQAPSVNS